MNLTQTRPFAHWAKVFILLVAAVAGGCGQTSKLVNPTVATPPAAYSGKIAFVSGQNDQRKIFVVNADGSNLRQLTDNAPRDDNPRWSHDGKQIAFESYFGGTPKIYLINADGTGLRELKGNGTGDLFPVWSPDGK